MPQLAISTSIESGQMVVKLNGKTVVRNNASVTIELASGELFVLQWFVEGTPGSDYNITITSPLNARINRTRTIDETRRDFGGFDFFA